MIKDNVFLNGDVNEFNINVQLMMYTHLWESHQVLKILVRLASILAGKEYIYDFTDIFQVLNREGKVVDVPKKNIIEQRIIEPLEHHNKDLGDLINGCYNNRLRNDFAHGSFYIDCQSGSIVSIESESYESSYEVSFGEWDEIFFHAIMLSYYLTKILYDRRNNFIKDNPDKKYIAIERPLMSDKSKKQRCFIFPEEVDDNGHKCVSFGFCKNGREAL